MAPQQGGSVHRKSMGAESSGQAWEGPRRGTKSSIGTTPADSSDELSAVVFPPSQHSKTQAEETDSEEGK